MLLKEKIGALYLLPCYSIYRYIDSFINCALSYLPFIQKVKKKKLRFYYDHAWSEHSKNLYTYNQHDMRYNSQMIMLVDREHICNFKSS